MPKTKRDLMKRDIAAGVNHIQSAQGLIGRVYNQFDGVHEDYAEFLVLIAQSMEISNRLLLDFWRLAWGKIPDDLDTYRV